MRMALIVLSWFCSMAAVAESTLHGDLPRHGGRALEEIPGLDSRYGVLRARDGTRLRTILTVPSGASERPGVILFVQWLSCDSIELPASQADGWSRMLRQLARQSGMAMMRTEKAGVGDSEGGPCERLDYETELAHHRDALAALRSSARIDGRRIVVFGASMGGNMAPLVAAGQEVAGVMIWGGGAKSWFERTLGFERRAKEFGETPAAELDTYMKSLSRFLVAYLLDRQNPVDIGRDRPELQGIWSRMVGTGDGTQYGRTLLFHQQAQARNWPGAWAEVEAPVLILYGEYDWFEDASGHQLIADIVNRNGSGRARFVELPQTDHHFMRYPTARTAFTGEQGEVNSDAAVKEMLDWLGKNISE